VLSGAVNPSGKLTQTLTKSFYDSPSIAASRQLKADGKTNRSANTSTLLNGGAPNDGTGLDAADTNAGWATNPVYYDEGNLVGYRWFDTKCQTEAEYNGKVAYPFGFGLSYTTFEFGNIKLDKTVFDSNRPGETITVSADVTNTGGIRGAEVAQMYLSMEGYASEGRPMKDLRGYEKIELDPGETKTVTFAVKLSDIVYFDDGQAADKILTGSSASSNVEYGQGKGWTVTPGSVFNIIIGDTSNNFELEEKGVSASFAVDYGVTFRTGANDSVKSIAKAAGKALTAEITVDPDKNTDYVVYAALYGADGKLYGATPSALVTAAGVKKTVSLDIDIPADPAGMVYKLFIWDGSTSAPVTNNFELR
jgi:hypothetical protein